MAVAGSRKKLKQGYWLGFPIVGEREKEKGRNAVAMELKDGEAGLENVGGRDGQGTNKPCSTSVKRDILNSVVVLFLPFGCSLIPFVSTGSLGVMGVKCI